MTDSVLLRETQNDCIRVFYSLCHSFTQKALHSVNIQPNFNSKLLQRIAQFVGHFLLGTGVTDHHELVFRIFDNVIFIIIINIIVVVKLLSPSPMTFSATWSTAVEVPPFSNRSSI